MTALLERRWRVMVALWLVLVSMSAYEIVPASVLLLIIEDLSISASAASWLISVQLLAMALLAIPAGMILDQRDNRFISLVAVCALFGAAVWSWWAAVGGEYYSLLASRLFGGVAAVVLWTASVNVVSGVFADDRQATAVGFVSTAIPAGFVFGQLFGPQIATAYGWEMTFPILAAPAVVMMAVFALDSRSVSPAATGRQAPVWSEFRTLFRNRNVLLVSVMGFLALSLSMFYNSWLPSFLVDQFGFSLAGSGMLAAIFPAIGIVARAASGPISFRLFGGRRQPVVVASFAVLLPTTVVIAYVGRGAILYVLLVLAGFFTQFGIALMYTYVREFAAKNVVATALAILNALGFFGAFTAPIIAGVLIDQTDSYVAAFGYASALALLGLALALRTPEPVR
ncbi:MFS transporter [Natrarchaeobius oligotrophus]|uniref:MFS transporter n=1 Tax=Natrarchaeobius chitinivorans TaxID=1679083 RepID=A0A3N6MSY6_NATCH|nr:MFS transporter [Natrarchaeobius chitinivorans]RQG99451.1 MFS transporter [Natrarchaeobius chitinivorans]